MPALPPTSTSTSIPPTPSPTSPTPPPPAPRHSHPSTLKIFTLNVWGLKFISKDRPPRIQAIAAHLKEKSLAGEYDVICLQELWIEGDYEIIRDAVVAEEGGMKESRYFKTGALGSGLAIFSKFPIISATALPYSLSGLPLHVIAGDFFVNKAAGSVVVLHPVLGEVEVWSTHMHAAGEWTQMEQAHRMAQAWQLSSQIRASAERGRYVIACGDFNSSPWSLPIAIMRDYGTLLDSWLVTHPNPTSLHPSTASTDIQGITDFGMTCDSLVNSYSRGKPLSDEARRNRGKRLDYVWFRGPDVARRRPMLWKMRGKEQKRREGEGQFLEEGEPISDSMDDAPTLVCLKTEVVLTEQVPGEDFSYSDHFGLVATFGWEEPEGDPLVEDKAAPQNKPLRQEEGIDAPAGDVIGEEEGKTLLELDGSGSAKQSDPTTPTSATNIYRQLNKQKSLDYAQSPTKSQTITSAIQTLRSYRLISRKTSRFHLRLFAGSIALALALTISSAWQPKSWIQPIWTLLGVGTGALGATMLYVGFVWGEWENNLVREVVEQMELELRVSELEDKFQG